jgi:penicillin-binding protein 2
MLTPVAFEDRQRLLVRLGVLRSVAVVCLTLLAVGFWVLQVPEHQQYLEMAESNELRTIPLRAPRGVLFDRNGKVLVQNDYSYTIAIVREQSPNPRDLSDAVRRLAAATGVEEAHLADVVRRHRLEASFRPISVIEHASFEQVAAVMARKLELPEVVVQQVPTRSYPQGGFAAHLFGYVSEVQESQLQQVEYAGLTPGAIVGQAGLERTYNANLMGKDGAKYVAVNSRGREIEERGEEEPEVGARLMLTIDYDLQRALETAYKALGLDGAAVFLDPRNGDVLAMTSQPEYDPNDFANGLGPEEWTALTTDPSRPLQNRLIQGRYSPGSTFKVLMAVAALSEGLITPDYRVTCTGSKEFYGHVFHCDKKEGHGTLDLRHAIEQSCDVYFYTVANLMKIDTIHRYAELLGLVGKTGIDLPGENESLVPSTEWKMRTAHEKWYPGETISVGIGQGQVSVTPIALARMITAVANGGALVTPHVVKAVDLGQGWADLRVPAPRTLFKIPQDVLEPVHDGLWLAVNGVGTASRARIPGHDLSGKTGTAQVISDQKRKELAGKTALNLKPHAWFEFYAPRAEPEIAGVVMAEHGGYGAEAAVPIAKFVLDTYFAKQDGKPLPVWPKPNAPAVQATHQVPAPTTVAAEAPQASPPLK